MRAGAGFLIVLAAACLSACSPDAALPGAEDGPSIPQPGFGSNTVFREALSAAPGHELLVDDLALGPDAVGDAHSHPWEEYLYVLGGQAVLDIEGMERRVLNAGESFVIPAGAVHTPKAGPQGIRALVLRVHKQGDPVSVPALAGEMESAGE